MLNRADDRMAAVTGLVATVAVGVGGLFGDWPASPGALPLWWAAYLLFVATFLLDGELVVARPRWAPERILLALEVVCALAAWATAPAAGWTAILFVITAVSGAYALSPSGAIGLVVGQSVAVAAGTAWAGGSTGDVVLMTVLYGAFQAFACLVVLAGRREAEQRVALAAAHADLRAASALLAVSTRDAERLRISRDLHDVVGHQLTALALELEVASHQAVGPSAEHVHRARSIAKDLLSDVRSTVGDLRGDVQGLAGALKDAVGPTPGLLVDLRVQDDLHLDQPRALVLVRCLQEVVTNTLRHAGATHLTVDVAALDDAITLTARDDGRGTRRLELGNGLTGMTERVEETGGTVGFETAPGRGFRTTVRLPA